MLKLISGVSAIMLTAAASAGIVRWNSTPDCKDQKFWQSMKSHVQYQALMKRADEMLADEVVSPLPLYLECSQTGNRVNYERQYFKFRHFGPLVAAYCTTGDVKYLKNIEARLRMLLSLPSWVLPAHDRFLKGYRGEEVVVDLFSANLGSELATALFILEPALDKKLASNVRKAVFHHVITPIEEAVEGKCELDRFWWLNGSNNWNPVCKRGVISAALRIGMEKERIDKILKLFFGNFENYMASFGNEGYCDEGLGYWGGSCGEYLIISALLKQYDGRDVLSGEPRMLKAVMYPENIMMAPGFYPAYTDCSINSAPGMYTLQLRNILLGKRKGFSDDIKFGDGLVEMCMRLYYPVDNTPVEVKNDAPFSKFTNAGAFVMRQMPGSPLSVSFKGGHNRESHNHNDVGTYIVAVDGVPLVLDPGGEIYSARTFSPRRYESNLLNSYGHSVPRINGKLQTNRVGGDAFNPPENKTPVELICGVLLEHNISADYGMAKFDISRVYNHIPEVKKLERTFVFDRKNGGSFTVSDVAEFSKPVEFENPVITLGEVKKLGENKYLISWDGDKNDPEKKVNWKSRQLIMEVKSSVPYKFSIDTIKEDTWHQLPVHRLAFTAAEKCENIKMEFIYTPVK